MSTYITILETIFDMMTHVEFIWMSLGSWISYFLTTFFRFDQTWLLLDKALKALSIFYVIRFFYVNRRNWDVIWIWRAVKSLFVIFVQISLKNVVCLGGDGLIKQTLRRKLISIMTINWWLLGSNPSQFKESMRLLIEICTMHNALNDAHQAME